jgi:hypothetical protein
MGDSKKVPLLMCTSIYGPKTVILFHNLQFANTILFPILAPKKVAIYGTHLFSGSTVFNPTSLGNYSSK